LPSRISSEWRDWLQKKALMNRFSLVFLKQVDDSFGIFLVVKNVVELGDSCSDGFF
jgi:hypothetical protein